MRWEFGEEKYVRFLAAKSRVVPLKELSISRLELQAAVLAERLYKSIRSESRIKFEKVIFFTDSQIVIAWIRSESRAFKPVVSVRVGEIQCNSDPCRWRNISGEINVANDVSRGIETEQLEGRWQRGPDFLYLPEREWPQETTDRKKEDKDVEEIMSS